MHVDKRCRVAKVDDNGGASTNVSYQLSRERPIVLYLVHTCHSVLLKLELTLSASLWYAGLQIRAGSGGMRRKHQPPWSRHALVEQP